MGKEYFNRFRSYQRSLQNLEKSRHASVEQDFVLEGTVQNFNLTFDLAWKVMKDILVKQLGIIDFAIGAPREVLKKSFSNGLITDDNWLKMLRLRNNLAHDYDYSLAKDAFIDIVTTYYDLFNAFAEHVEENYLSDQGEDSSIR